MKNLVVIGGLGKIGFYLLKTLENDTNLNIVCIAKPGFKNQKKAKVFKKIKFIWADALELDLFNIFKNADVVINLAAVLPPLSEVDVETSQRINYHFIKDILENIQPTTKLIFLSTAGVKFYDAESESKFFAKHYLMQKRNAENDIISSHFLYTIIRPPFVWENCFPAITSSLFDIPLSNKMEFIHVSDVVYAIHQAIEKHDNEIIDLGGNQQCQITYKDYLAFCFAGYYPTDDDLFSKHFYPTDWIQGSEYQQKISFETMVKEGQKSHPLIYLYRRLFKSYIVRKWKKLSPYHALGDKAAAD